MQSGRESNGSGARWTMLMECKDSLERNLTLTDGEIKGWRNFLQEFSLSELRYAFESWERNNRWFPKKADIRELCEAYRMSETAKQDAETPVGCERCDWSGFYTVTWHSNVERVVAECPCRTNPSLRTKCNKNMATLQEKREMYMALKAFGDSHDMNKVIEKTKQVSGIIPTTKELAEQLSKGRRWESE